ncbi:hypothetical protein Glove_543g97 [Diversispora epigaea]|uniref:Uncharacterized protein n=1 Tax=Diversispora epigaea TaxID=1348612 RepID=A0A397GG00_9GLOM|nr:hypothetical protein Glove_543g97 [Diversispora epigaea]
MSRLDQGYENLSLSLESENMDLNKECGTIDLYEKNENNESNYESEKEISNQENERIALNKENDGYSTRDFQYNYPISSFIRARYIIGNRILYYWYKVISLGFYPTSVKLTQKNSKNCVQYQVPDDYSVETEVSKFKIRCETKYQQNNKVRFTIIWKENNSEWSIYSEQSATSVTNEFLKHRLGASTALSITSINKKKFKLTQKNSKNCVQYQVPDDYSVETEVSKFKIRCETKYQQNNKVRFTIIWKENNSEWSIYSEQSATSVTNEFLKHRLGASTALSITSINKKKCSLSKIQTSSGQYKRFLSLGKESGKEIRSLIKKNYFNGESVILNYKSPNEKNELNKIDAIVRACDESLLARDGYRQLAAIEPCLIWEYSIANRRIEITNKINKDIKIGTFNIDKNENLFDNLENLEKSDEDIIINDVEIGNGVYRSINTLLKILIPI